MDNNISLATGIVLSVLVFLVLLMALVPYYTRRTVSFGIAVPENAYHDPYLTKLRRRYLVTCLIVGAAVIVIGLLLFARMGSQDMWWVMILSMIIFIAVSMILYLLNFRQVKKYKQQSNWKIEEEQEGEAPPEGVAVKKPISAAWYLVYAAVIGVMSILTAAIYPSLPAQLPMHYDLSGAVDRYAAKTPLNAAMLLIVMLFIGLVFLGIHYGVTRAKQHGDYHRDSVFRSAMSKGLFAIGLLTLLLLSTVQLAILGIVPTQWVIFFPLVFIILIFSILIAIAVNVGQSGSRVKGGAQGKPDVAEDDSHWVLGLFYKNKNDPSVWVERRYGFGYTLNIAHPASIVIIVALALGIATIIILAVNATSSTN